jgi:hypothetical protein
MIVTIRRGRDAAMSSHMLAEPHGWASEAMVRTAQRRAFDKMLAASESDEFSSVVQEAVRDLLDACEAYIAER